jgi:hypothetical protein
MASHADLRGPPDWPAPSPARRSGRIGGGGIGARLAKRLSAQRQTLTQVPGCLLVVVSGYMLYRSLT